ncbi:AraC family transcriptional regulator [Teredinibacter sp. KSP-S5-2]|uniref:helix-turn-helix domain-containing protein n=1 Tax=Teredinibacter sp. KSP-S5-2 TaxID=3034506 RepID=UPI0029350A5D|nr:AraC family transcriptional regulator [Teredinibacter sp. KSP-S5-2]WNO08844.1 AraC family transcriptional regulator [Teredinibacter sp. KSP-S5-2]
MTYFALLFGITKSLYMLGTVQCLILALFLFLSKRNTYANRILAAWVLLFAFELTQIVVMMLGMRETNFYVSFDSLYGVLFFFYLRSFSYGKGFAKTDLLHFILPCLCFIYLFMTNDNVGAYVGLGYAIFNFLYLRRYRKRMKSQLSDVDRINIRWLYGMTVYQLVMWLGVLAIVSFMFIFSPPWNWFLPTLSYIPATIWIFLLAYLGLAQPKVFVVHEVEINHTQPAEHHDVDERLKLRLLSVMDEKQLYLDGNLTLSDLAQQLGSSAHEVSHVINQAFDKNFCDFINGYRVKEAEQRLRRSSDKIISIAYDSGFNSKSSFNHVFKQMTQHTPSEYRKKFAELGQRVETLPAE